MHHYSDKTFTFSVPAVNNVKIWKVEIKSMSAKEFGVMRPGALHVGTCKKVIDEFCFEEELCQIVFNYQRDCFCP